jgi:hypothetical protein
MILESLDELHYLQTISAQPAQLPTQNEINFFGFDSLGHAQEFRPIQFRTRYLFLINADHINSLLSGKLHQLVCLPLVILNL